MTGSRFPTRDHVVPKSRGGSGHSSNILVVCSPCNGQKGSMLLSEWIMELLFGPPSKSGKLECVVAVHEARKDLPPPPKPDPRRYDEDRVVNGVRFGKQIGPACALVKPAQQQMAAE